MSQDRLVEDSVLKAGLSAHLVIGKVQEILRLLKMKIPVGYLKSAEMCRHLVAIKIACAVLDISVDEAKLMAQSPISSKHFQEALIHCKRVLKIRSDADTMQKLTVQFGSHVQTAANEILEMYNTFYIEKLDKNRQSLVNTRSSECQAAAFYIAGTKNKMKLSKTEVAAIAEIDASYFSTVVEAMNLIVKNHPNVKADSRIATSIRTSIGHRNANVTEPAVSTLKRSRPPHDMALIINGREYPNDVCSKIPLIAANKTNNKSNLSSCSGVMAGKEIVKVPGQESFNQIAPATDPIQGDIDKSVGDKENEANETEKRESYDRWRRKILDKRLQ